MADAAYRMAVIDGDKILHTPQRVKFDPELVVRQSA
jgi:hypothetical protein